MVAIGGVHEALGHDQVHIMDADLFIDDGASDYSARDYPCLSAEPIQARPQPGRRPIPWKRTRNRRKMTDGWEGGDGTDYLDESARPCLWDYFCGYRLHAAYHEIPFLAGLRSMDVRYLPFADMRDQAHRRPADGKDAWSLEDVLAGCGHGTSSTWSADDASLLPLTTPHLAYRQLYPYHELPFVTRLWSTGARYVEWIAECGLRFWQRADLRTCSAGYVADYGTAEADRQLQGHAPFPTFINVGSLCRGDDGTNDANKLAVHEDLPLGMSHLRVGSGSQTKSRNW